MPRKILIWLLVSLNVFILVILVGLKLKLNSTKKQTLTFPVIIEKYSSIGTHPDWVLRKIQPRFVGFKTESNRNYLIVEYQDFNGQLITQKVFVTGVINQEKTIDKILLETENAKVENLDFNGLKQKLPKNSQIGVEYFATVPNPDTPLGAICDNLENFCKLVELMNSVQDKDTIYAFKIYLNLPNE